MPLTESKRGPAGAALRRGLLARAGLPADLATPRGAKPDDLLDALAALAVARAIANGRGVPYPDPPERDAHGLPAAIWTLPSSEAPA
jgi:predicted RNase H-like nuclease